MIKERFKYQSGVLCFKVKKRLGTNMIVFGIDPHHTAFEMLMNHYPLKSSFTIGYQWFDTRLNFEDFRFNFADFDNYL